MRLLQLRLMRATVWFFSVSLLAGSISCRQQSPPELVDPLVQRYVTRLRHYAKPGYNQRIAFYLDLTRPSGQPRFFVLDLPHGRVLARGLCASGRTDAQGRVLYSNVPDSHCSSRGLAKVTTAYTGRFGRAYKLVGLQASNRNVFRRFIVLHAHGCVPTEPQPDPICLSQGCPTVSPEFLVTLSRYLDRSPQPILLYTN